MGDRVVELEALLQQANDSHAQTRDAAAEKARELNATIAELQVRACVRACVRVLLLRRDSLII